MWEDRRAMRAAMGRFRNTCHVLLFAVIVGVWDEERPGSHPRSHCSCLFKSIIRELIGSLNFNQKSHVHQWGAMTFLSISSQCERDMTHKQELLETDGPTPFPKVVSRWSPFNCEFAHHQMQMSACLSTWNDPFSRQSYSFFMSRLSLADPVLACFGQNASSLDQGRVFWTSQSWRTYNVVGLTRCTRYEVKRVKHNCIVYCILSYTSRPDW